MIILMEFIFISWDWNLYQTKNTAMNNLFL
jgi:hypothetical protein